jgi:hypothetical protein
MKYIYVKNGNVESIPRELPNIWENVSNFNVLDNATVKEYGWYPYRFVPGETSEDMVSNGSYFVIGNDEVVEYQSVRPKTDEERQAEINSLWENIRNQRNFLLEKSDWTQLSDSPLNPEKKEEWLVYRQALRDITNQLNPKEIVWPIEPN